MSAREFSLDVEPVEGAPGVYLVRTRTAVPDYGVSEVEVVRKGADFKWLRTALTEEYPRVVVPPIPEAPRGEFNDNRRIFYQRFLRRAVLHPLLHSSTMLRAFLEGSEAELSEAKSKTKGVVARFFSNLGKEMSSDFLGYNEPDLWFEQHGRITYALQRQNEDAWENAQETRDTQTQLTQSYTQLGASLRSLGGADTQEELSKSTMRLGYAVDSVAELYAQQTLDVGSRLSEVFEDAALVSSSARNMLDNRKRTIVSAVAKEKLSEKMETKCRRQRQEKGSESASDRQRADAAREEFEKISEDVNETTRLARDELQRIDLERVIDLRASLLRLVYAELESAEKIENVWRNILDELPAPKRLTELHVGAEGEGDENENEKKDESDIDIDQEGEQEKEKDKDKDKEPKSKEEEIEDAVAAIKAASDHVPDLSLSAVPDAIPIPVEDESAWYKDMDVKVSLGDHEDAEEKLNGFDFEQSILRRHAFEVDVDVDADTGLGPSVDKSIGNVDTDTDVPYPPTVSAMPAVISTNDKDDGDDGPQIEILQPEDPFSMPT